jgi:hypothetical protein
LEQDGRAAAAVVDTSLDEAVDSERESEVEPEGEPEQEPEQASEQEHVGEEDGHDSASVAEDTVGALEESDDIVPGMAQVTLSDAASDPTDEVSPPSPDLDTMPGSDPSAIDDEP